MSIKPTERELDIINSLVAGWEKEGNMLLCGGISYSELFDWLKEIGATAPTKAIWRIAELSKKLPLTQ